MLFIIFYVKILAELFHQTTASLQSFLQLAQIYCIHTCTETNLQQKI